MCGICGIVRSDLEPVAPPLLERMNAALRHRGPDGQGFFYRPGLGLAMRRLAVIDLNTGDQPIANEDESKWIVFNGEIYNFADLRLDLEKRGHCFRTRTDTEVVLHLYEEHGPECVRFLRGMFAFALWDEKKQSLLIARDRLGKKPLYYALQNGSLYLSSELAGLLTVLPSRPPVNLQAIDLYLSLQYIPEPLTAYENIFKLLPAHRLTWHAGEVQIERYWQLEFEPKLAGSGQELAEELRERLRQAVTMRLVSDVPLGAHLSGGIDSSIVVALMAEASSRPVKTFTADFQESAFSETAYARSVARRYATDHHEFTLTYQDIPGSLAELLTHFGEPFADPSALPLYHLARLTREHVTVALNGDGGDEAFAGYQRYSLDPWANRYLRLPAFITRKLAPALVRNLPDRADLPSGKDRIGGLKRLEQLASIDPRASLLRWGSYFSPGMKANLWKPEYRTVLDLRQAETILRDHFEAAPAQSFLDRTLSTDISTYLPGDLLVKADRMTMAHSLEARSPFLDHELMGWAARLPGRMKVRYGQGKVLLREAFREYLPPEVRRRGKQGFGVPVNGWLRLGLASWVRDLMHAHLTDWFEVSMLSGLMEEHHSGRSDHGKRLWALVVLALWKQTAAVSSQ